MLKSEINEKGLNFQRYKLDEEQNGEKEIAFSK